MQFQIRVYIPYPIADQNGQNIHPISDQNGIKPYPLGPHMPIWRGLTVFNIIV